MEIPILGSWITAAVILFSWIFYLYLTWNFDYWKKRGIPYVKPVPVFGNLKDAMLAKKTIGEVFQDIYWKLNGCNFGGLFKFSKPGILLRDPELIKTVLVREFTSFHDNDVHVDINIDPMFGRNPFVLPGESWKITRAQLMPAFTVSKLKPLFPLVNKVCQEFSEYIEKKHNSGEIEAKELCARFTTDVVATCAFGIHGNSIQDPNAEFRRMGIDMLEPTFSSNIKLLTILFSPWLAKILKLRFITKKVEAFFRRMIKEVIDYREKNNVTRNDYLQYLINLKNKGAVTETNGYSPKPDKNIFTEEDVVAQATTFFGDGFETSSNALSFALYCLATNPDIQNRAREEVKAVMQKHGNQVTFEAIHEMPYLDMVLQESLRMYPAAIYLARMCTKPFTLEHSSGVSCTIPVGTPVIVPVLALHYDPQYFPNPKHYDPERFSEENKKNINKYIYLPFGEGPRICLGQRFGQMQVKACLVAMLSKFDLCTTPNTPMTIVPDPNYFMFAAKGGLWMQFRRRNSSVN